MSSNARRDPEWREFERLVARVEADAGPRGFVVKSPDRLRCKLTGRLREVDATIRGKVGTSDVLITIECRRRSKVQDVTWIEQLATKKSSIGAHTTIAVSLSGFSTEAETLASKLGIVLRKISDLSVNDLNPLLGLDFVMFWHKACACSGVGVRWFRPEETTTPQPEDIEYVLPSDCDLLAPIFHDVSDGSTWSINDVWHEVQEALNPFAEIEKAAPPQLRTARIPYPGTVTLDTPDGPRLLGHVFLSVAMWIEPEMVPIDEALKVQYADRTTVSIQRVEFASQRTPDWRISLQVPAEATDILELRVGGNWPNNGKEKP